MVFVVLMHIGASTILTVTIAKPQRCGLTTICQAPAPPPHPFAPTA